MLSWVFRHDQRRDDLREPAPIELVYYHLAARDLHNRLIGEFSKALELMEQRQRAKGCEPRSKKAVPFRAVTWPGHDRHCSPCHGIPSGPSRTGRPCGGLRRCN